MSEGSCACGAVRYEVTEPLRDVWDCHCRRCRKVTGHHMAATSAAPDAVRVADRAALRWWEAAPGVEYGFCGTCGSTLFWRAADQPDKLCIAAGTLDGPTGLRTTKAWWCEQAGDYFERPPGLEEFAREG